MKIPKHNWSGLTRTWVGKILKMAYRPRWRKHHYVLIPKRIIEDYGLHEREYVLLTLNFFNTRRDLLKYIIQSKNRKARKIRTLEELNFSEK